MHKYILKKVLENFISVLKFKIKKISENKNLCHISDKKRFKHSLKFDIKTEKKILMFILSADDNNLRNILSNFSHLNSRNL